MSSDYVRQFEYPNVVGKASDGAESGDTQLWAMEPDPRQKQERALREAQAREIGRIEGETKAKSQIEEMLRKERETLRESLEKFAGERSQYFEKVEAEVVQLALSIARKVLHREAQIDPDLLMGLVRYTLEKLRDGTRVKVRVHPSRVPAWRQLANDETEVVGDSKLEPGLCMVETELGTTAVGVDAQLKEIEQGLIDLLAQRPEAR